jgi:hypothetical protein
MKDVLPNSKGNAEGNCSASGSDSSLSTWVSLHNLGFVEDRSVISDPPPGLSFDFGYFKLEASRLVNRSMRPIVMLSGMAASERSIGDLQTELPLEVESMEQAKAFVAWCFDRLTDSNAPSRFEPKWIEEGRQHSSLLPWNRNLAAYKSRPCCYVESDWARVAFKKLATKLATLDHETAVTFSFDGELLTIRSKEMTIVVQAEGSPWSKSYSIKAGSLWALPNRLSATVGVSVWKSALEIGNRRYEGVVPIG